MRILSLGSLLLGVLVLAGCTYNPATGRSQYLSLSEEEEIAGLNISEHGMQHETELQTPIGLSLDKVR